jgi:hypothetical protein
LVRDETLRAQAGSLLYVPKGALHTHRNVGEGAGRMLVTQPPGGLYERFFEEVGEAAGDAVTASLEEGSPEAATIVEAAARYGIEIILLDEGRNRTLP